MIVIELVAGDAWLLALLVILALCRAAARADADAEQWAARTLAGASRREPDRLTV